jgi:hypothetical protein
VSAGAVVFSFWWPMYRANRVLERWESNNQPNEVQYHHPAWTEFFLGEESFHPWFDELHFASVYGEPATERLLDDLSQFRVLKRLQMRFARPPLDKFRQLEPLEFLALLGSESSDQHGTPLSRFYRGEHASLELIDGADWGQLVADLQVEFLTIKYLNVHGRNVANPNITKLRFGGCKIHRTTGEGIAGLSGIKSLILDESVVEPAFWNKFSDHPSLTALTLKDSPVSGEGWKHLCRVEGLKELRLNFPWDKSISSTIPRYELLNPPLQPEESGPGDTDWGHLSGLTNLEQLAIGQVRLSENALRAIVALPNLRMLELKNVTVEASSLTHLADSASLKSVDIRETNVTADELREFIEKNPHLEVTHDLSE